MGVSDYTSVEFPGRASVVKTKPLTDRKPPHKPIQKQIENMKMTDHESMRTKERKTAVSTKPLAKSQIANNKVFDTLEEVPSDLHGITTDGVVDCLKLIGLGKHADKFIENDIDGDLLLDLNVSILVDDFQMSKFEAQKVQMFAHQNWRPKKD